MQNSSDLRLSVDAAKLAAQLAAQYLPQNGQPPFFDPFHNASHFLLGCVLASFTLFLICYWRSLLNWISEDNVLRCDRFCLQYWLFLQCCGICDGEWSRCFSSVCCRCCPSLRGRNLKRVFGEWLGISPVPIRVQNIMLGGLPRCRDSWFSQSSPDVYVQITPDELQPTLSTEVVTQANIDCVQFTSGFTLQVKNNVSEDPVRICVREMRMIGSRDIADCYVCPTRLIAWARCRKKVRVRLSPLPGLIDPMRTPWVLLDLSVPGEMKYLRSAIASFNPIIMETKTTGAAIDYDEDADLLDEGLREVSRRPSEPPGGAGSPRWEMSCMPAAQCMPARNSAPVEQPLVLLPVTATSGYKMYNKFDDFRDQYPLLNEKGSEVMEMEDMVGRDSMRFAGYVRASLCYLIVCIIVYLSVRVYTTTCLEEYRQLEVVYRFSQHDHLPFRAWGPYHRQVQIDCNFVRKDISKWATNMLRHKWINSMVKQDLGIHGRTATLDRMCNPTINQTLSFCRGIAARINGSDTPLVFNAVPCNPISCSVDTRFQDWDVVIIAMCFVWGVGVLVGRACVEHRMRRILERPTKENFFYFFEKLLATQPPPGTAGQSGGEEERALIRPQRRAGGMGGGMGFTSWGGKR